LTPAIPDPEAQLRVAGATASLPKTAVGVPENASSVVNRFNFHQRPEIKPRGNSRGFISGLMQLTPDASRWQETFHEVRLRIS
jgi:hypothetical protein